MACGLLAGCDLVTTDAKKDYEQVIAEVNITESEEFNAGGEFAAYKDVIGTESIYKRDMVASFVASGSSVMSQYGWTYHDTFEAIKDSLINRQVYVQYAKVYFLSQGNSDCTVQGYQAAVNAATGGELDKAIAGLGYFLTEEEEQEALYGLRSSFNSSLDAVEEGIIDADEDDADSASVRTTPTGVDTESEHYYDADYRIYTGTETVFGSYEKVEGSTAYTRRQAYSTFLTNLRSSGLLDGGEDTTKIEELSYFKRERKNSYESAIINKLSDAFEEEAAKGVTDQWMKDKYDTILKNQKDGFEADTLSIDDALDGMSDSSFVLTAPQAGYGFVINILLPFSAQQTQDLGDIEMDKGDTQGNKFAWRASILKNVLATDQRGTWFTGEEDYSFDGTDAEGLYNAASNGAARSNYLFFENSLSADKSGEGKQYEPLKNYYGKYSYNGTVTKDDDGKYTVKPNKIKIDGFISEMEGYLKSAGLTTKVTHDIDGNYYKQTDYYDKDGKVDYSKFVYYEGNVEFGGGFNAKNMFVAGSPENKAFSVINELSFAYNTDTAGLNTYLGYAVTPKKTDFVSEFEYAAQEVCKKGAGHYIVVPSDYGWHIIYCTFSFTDDLTPFGAAGSFDAADKDTEGSFANLFYEAQKTAATNSYSSNKQTDIINRFAEVGSTVYEDRYADLSGLDSAS